MSDEPSDVAGEYEGKLDPEVFEIRLTPPPGMGVQLTHLPTGLVARSWVSKTSQIENRDAALAQLREMLRERGQEPDF
jgi:hypothetical protein